MSHPTSRVEFRVKGRCPICEAPAEFCAVHDGTVADLWLRAYLRDHFLCSGCGSIPRERALFAAIEKFYPHWRTLAIHESSPFERGATPKLRREARSYIASQYDPALGFGKVHPSLAYRSEDLAAQTFPDASFDLVVTQDVFEHLFDPANAIREIVRTLKPGGAHIFTVPIVNESKPSQRRARMVNGRVEHLVEPQYHGNPVSSDGSLVTIDWGFDIVQFLAQASGAPVAMVDIDDVSRGIHAVYCEVLVVWKPPANRMVL